MQKRAIPILIVLMSISLLGIIFIQYRWIERAINEKQALIDNQVYQAVAEVEQQLTDRRAMTFLTDSAVHELGIDGIMNPLDIGFEERDEFVYRDERDSVIMMEIKVSSNEDTHQWNDGHHVIEHRIERHANINTDSLTIIEIEQGLGQLESVINRIKLEFHSESDYRIDSSRIGGLLTEEFSAKGLGHFSDWAVFDNSKANYAISPQNTTKADYDIPLFTTDIMNPGRYHLQITLSQSNLIWTEIWPMVLLSVLFILIISAVFIYSIKLIVKHKKISQIKSDFINNMTHEFKTPLASISLAADSLIHPNTPLNKASVEKYVAIIQAEKTKLNAQVERILEVAALTKDAVHIPLEKLDVNQIIREAIKHFQLQEEKELVTIDFQETGPFEAIANRSHLEGVIINLVDNGIKYSKGKAIIQIRTDPQNGLIQITDQGIGMDYKQLTKVFDHFYRAQTGNVHDTKGFGLGLSYCKQVLLKMNGDIRLESKTGQGTTAFIKLQQA